MVLRLLGNLLLATVAVAVTVLLAEVAARYLLPDWAPLESDRGFWHHDPLLGWAHRPGQSGYQVHPDFRVRVEINALGMRDREYTAKRGNAERRMLVLGDSFTFGHGVEQDEIFHERIEARRSGWEILNAGVSGYGTDQQWLYYRDRGSELDADVVVVVLHANDFLDAQQPIRYGYPKPLFVLHEGGELELTGVPVAQRPLSLRFDHFLAERTYLLVRLFHFREYYEGWQEARREEALRAEAEARAAEAKAQRQKRRAALSEEERQARRAERKRRAAEKARDGANAAAPPARPSKYDVDIALNEAILRALDARVRADGAELLLVSIPMPDAPRARLRAASERIGLRHLSLDAAFDAVREPTRFENDPHWTPLGHEVAADAIEAFLIEQDVFETGAAR